MSTDDTIPSLPPTVATWLETVAEGDATLRRQPDSTIVPEHLADAAGQRALALLEEIGGASESISIGETIGQGGMGIVRDGEQRALGRTVAVKTLRPDRRGREATLALLREAWVTGAVEHPNVVPVHALGLEQDGSPVIILKRVEGTAWSELVGDPARVLAEQGSGDALAWNLQILMQVLNALRFAHSRGIIHRDVKPENVMIGAFGEVYLLDWGIAVSLRDDPSGRLPLASDATELAGTPCYMAPEMLGPEADHPLSERTDVYLAGAVLHEIISGAPPHPGKSLLEVLAHVAASRPELPAGAPPELARICRRAMAPLPGDRFESCEALRRALQEYLEHRGSEQLAALARVGLDELRAAAASPAAGNPAARRESIYRLFGACRFGFHQALSSWAENPEAQRGLGEAIRAVARFELAEGDPRAAVGLLAELDEPPAELSERARRAAREREVREAELRELERRMDWSIGSRTRSFLALVLGTGFTVLPLLAATVLPHGLGAGYPSHVGWSLGWLAAVLALGYWARETLSKTTVNRRVFAMVSFLFVAQTALYAGCYLAGVPLTTAELAMMFLWFSQSGMFVIGSSPRIWPSAIAYLVAFLVAARWLDLRLYAMAAANVVLTINAVWIWRPPAVRYSDAERAARGLAPRP